MAYTLYDLGRKIDNLESILKSMGRSVSVGPVQADETQGSNDNRRNRELMCGSEPTSFAPRSKAEDRERSDADLLDLIITVRGLRSRYIDHDLLYDPVWNIALDLTLAKLRDQFISVSSVCLASGVPDTTALRYLSIMEKHDLIERSADPSDKRRIFVQISEHGERAVLDYLGRVRSLLEPGWG